MSKKRRNRRQSSGRIVFNAPKIDVGKENELLLGEIALAMETNNGVALDQLIPDAMDRGIRPRVITQSMIDGLHKSFMEFQNSGSIEREG